MLTLFAVPKPFRGHIGTIQRNAIRSWLALRPRCQVILFGDEEGLAEVADTFGVQHVADVARNEFGTPLLNDVFTQAERLATTDVICYVNSDIIFAGGFTEAVNTIRRRTQRFLIVGECWNLDITEPLDFTKTDWGKSLARVALQKGKRRGRWWIDYFVFPKGLYESLPPFALGRAGYDNWLVWKARNLKATVVDVTRAVIAVHQNHDYSHVSGGLQYTQKGEEARRNLTLAGGQEHLYRIDDATHRLTPAGLRRNLGAYIRWEYRKPRVKARINHFWWWLVELTRPGRHRVGLRMATLQKLKTRLIRD